MSIEKYPGSFGCGMWPFCGWRVLLASRQSSHGKLPIELQEVGASATHFGKRDKTRAERWLKVRCTSSNVK